MTRLLKLIDALEIVHTPPKGGASIFDVKLVCGFSPLHFATFVLAYLQQYSPDRQVRLDTGLYGDLPSGFSSLQHGEANAGIVVVEWASLDPRLGLRQLGGWGVNSMTDMLKSVNDKLQWLDASLKAIPETTPVALSLPTLPLPPVGYTTRGKASLFDLELRQMVAAFAVSIAGKRNLRVADLQLLEQASPLSARYDVNSELSVDFPYFLPHASAVAWQLTRLLRHPAPKKGLITDLDDTLWSGIVGDDGILALSWDLDHKSQVHGLFQQLLRALADEGVLLAVASRNERSVVEQALSREDLILPRDKLFPIEVSWQAKSEAVGRILRAWNVGADSVVFVDDNEMELAEVKAAHPDIECLQFPKQDPQAVYRLLEHIRDLFSKDSVSEEDRIRLPSIRQAEVASEVLTAAGLSVDDFLRGLEAEVTFDYRKDPSEARPLELVNKTNQFNLNGERHTEASWVQYFEQEDTFLVVVAYHDRFGPLGKIAVMAGRNGGTKLYVDTWVMSCRAFARRIEHRCLDQLFSHFPVSEISLDFVPTQRNEPLRQCLTELLGKPATSPVLLSQACFRERCPVLFQKVREVTHG